MYRTGVAPVGQSCPIVDPSSDDAASSYEARDRAMARIRVYAAHLQGAQRRRLVQTGEITPRPAAILGRAGAVSGDAAWIALARLGRPMILDPDLMPPRDVEVVVAGEPGALAQPQCCQRDVGRGRRGLPSAVAVIGGGTGRGGCLPSPSPPGARRAARARCRRSAPAHAATPSG